MDKTIKARLTHNQQRDDFDFEYWQSLGPEAIMHAAAQMTEEVYRFKGIPADQSIFRKDVVHIIRLNQEDDAIGGYSD